MYLHRNLNGLLPDLVFRYYRHSLGGLCGLARALQMRIRKIVEKETGTLQNIFASPRLASHGTEFITGKASFLFAIVAVVFGRQSS